MRGRRGSARTIAAAAVVAALGGATTAGAGEAKAPGGAEDRDLDLIPAETAPAPAAVAAPPAARPPPSRLRGKVYLEDAFTVAGPARALVVPFPPPQPYTWQNRANVDARAEWRPLARLVLTFSDRANVIAQEGAALWSRQTVRNDLREGYVGVQPVDGLFLEAGRINVRNGVALGFNPTDYFKTSTLVGQASLDPSVLRQNRLGTVMARGQLLLGRGSASVAFAPRLTGPPPLTRRNDLGVTPRLDATNAANRLLASVALDVADLSPEALFYLEGGAARFGLDVTRPIGDAVVAYLEWSGGRQEKLAARASAYGQRTGTLPPGTPVLPPTDAGLAFRSDVAAGASLTVAARVTINAEYHFHQAGFTRQDWASWFDIGAGARDDAAVTGTLWYVRGYANDQQEPVAAHQAFVRVDWPRALTRELELVGFAFVDLLDGSVLTQVAATYDLSDAWTLAAYGTAFIGRSRSDFGSFPQAASGIVDVIRYL